jgi:hypothetical protein
LVVKDPVVVEVGGGDFLFGVGLELVVCLGGLTVLMVIGGGREDSGTEETK